MGPEKGLSALYLHPGKEIEESGRIQRINISYYNKIDDGYISLQPVDTIRHEILPSVPAGCSADRICPV